MLTPIYRKYACAPFCRASGGSLRRWRVVLLETLPFPHAAEPHGGLCIRPNSHRRKRQHEKQCVDEPPAGLAVPLVDSTSTPYKRDGVKNGRVRDACIARVTQALGVPINCYLHGVTQLWEEGLARVAHVGHRRHVAHPRALEQHVPEVISRAHTVDGAKMT